MDYRESLGRYRDGVSDLLSSAGSLGSDWIATAERAVADPTPVLLPFFEELRFEAMTPGAAAYEFPAVRGHGITVSVKTPEGSSSGHENSILLELFLKVEAARQVRGTEAPLEGSSSSSFGAGLVTVAHLMPGNGSLYYEPQRHGSYVLVVQPKPLAAAHVTITVTTEAVLEWPVEGTTYWDVWSAFGDPRDGGRRVHHGLDIFAPRGTGIVAASPSTVMRAGTRDRGGNIVSLFDQERGIYLYYAHLDEHKTDRGRTVQPGQIIGTVGNTGNALTTPPHLHIGIYEASWRRPVDPWYFFVPTRDVLRRTEVDLAEFGKWVTIADSAAAIVRHPDVSGGIIPSPARYDARGNPIEPSSRPPEYLPRGDVLSSRLPVQSVVEVLGAHGPYLRVRSSEGPGYVFKENVAPARRVVEEVTVGMETPVFTRPVAGSDIRGVVPHGATIAVLGYLGTFGLINYDGNPGWIPLSRTGVMPAG